MIWSVHVVVHIGRLTMWTLSGVLVHLHISICGVLGGLLRLLLRLLLRCSRLLCLSALFAHALIPLLFLNSWCGRPAGP